MSDACATYGALMEDGARRLAEAGIEGARREARLILGIAGGLSPEFLLANVRDPVRSSLTGAYFRLIDRRAAREPLQHLAGETEFYGLSLACDPRALVPRPDSETVVDLALARLRPGRVEIADLGTGSGCLLLALLSARRDAVGLGIEASPGAAALAQDNAARTGLGPRCAILHTSWDAWGDWGHMDLIVSNPPYIATAEIETLAPEVRDHDPRPALDGGADGLAAYREIIALAAARMAPGADLVLELGWDQARAVEDLLAARGFVDIEIRRDLAGLARAIAARTDRKH